MRFLIAGAALVIGAASVQAAPCGGTGRVGLIQRLHDHRQARIEKRHTGTVPAPVVATVPKSVVVAGGCANGKCQLPALKK